MNKVKRNANEKNIQIKTEPPNMRDLFYNVEDIKINSIKFGLSEPPRHVYHPSSYLKKIEDQIIDLQINQLLCSNFGAIYLHYIVSNMQISEGRIKEVISKSESLRTCRLSYLPTEAPTQYTVEYFHNKSFLIIVYSDKRGLLLKLSEILQDNPDVRSFDDEKLNFMMQNLLMNNLYNRYDYSDDDFNIFLSLMRENSYRLDLMKQIAST